MRDAGRGDRYGQLGHELVAAGLLILAGVTDRGEVGRWVRIGYERGQGSLQGYDPESVA